MSHLFSNYGRQPVAFVKGEGMFLYDAEGKKHLDFGSGIAVTNLGHCHPKVTQAIQEQAATLMHTSNLYQIPGQELVAEKIASLTGLEKVFFCNSGAEANEAAIKLARKYSKETYGDHKYEILTFFEGFHGRTLATVTATARPQFQEGFAPLMPGFRYVEKDLEQVAATVSDATCAILIEPVQGEGGVLPLPQAFLQGLRQLCDEKGLLLLFDEVQTGIGRTGTMFAYEQAGVLPDIVSMAKGLGNGFPVGAIAAKEAIAAVFTPGTHGTTFGGTPLAMAAALATLTAIEEEGILANAKAMGEELTGRLNRLVDQYDCVQSTRGLGLLQGLLLDLPAAKVLQKCLDRGLILLTAGEKTLRFAPPLIVSSQEIHQAMSILEDVLAEVMQEAVQA